MHLKSLVLLACLFCVLLSQITSTTASKSLTVLGNCAYYSCPTEYKACFSDSKCKALITTCEVTARYNWNAWVNCTAGNSLAASLVSCRYVPMCELKYQQTYGVSTMNNYLKDAKIKKNFGIINSVPYGFQNSTNYIFDETCSAQTCESQAIYCLLNSDCVFLYSTCVLSSETDTRLMTCFQEMAYFSYYMASLLSCWNTNCLSQPS